jgi:hypothetical protein
MEDSKKRARKGTGRVAFLAHLDEIKKMIEAGHPLVSVFEEYESKLSIKSGQFGKYVRKYIRSKTNGNTDRAAEKGKDIKKAAPIRAREPGQPAFVSSDIPRDRDSLIGRKK